PPPPTPTLFPYTTLFRSLDNRADVVLLDPLSPVGQQARAHRTTTMDGQSLTHEPARSSARAIATASWCRSSSGIRPSAACRRRRSEEHTSELQSRGHLVC